MENVLISIPKKKLLKNNKYDIYDATIWEQNIGIDSVNLPLAIRNKNRAIQAEHDVLYSDNKAIYFHDEVKKKRQVDKNKKIKLFKYIPDGTEKTLIKVYKKINYMKNEGKELQKLNSLSLQKTSKCYFQTNRPKTSRIDFKSNENPNIKTQNTFFVRNFSKKNTNRNLNTFRFNDSGDKNSNDSKLLTNRHNELNNLYTNENTKEETTSNRNSIIKSRKVLSALNKTKKTNLSTLRNNQSQFAKSTKSKRIFSPDDLYQNQGEEKFRNLIDIDVEKLYSTNKRNKLNLSRINEIYRVQMNKSLKKYHPERHLIELNKIQLNDIKVRQDMEKVKGKINKKLYDRGQGLYYKKEYLKLKEENEKEKRLKSKEKKPLPVKIPFNIMFTKDERKKNIKELPPSYKLRAYYDYCASCDRIQKSKDHDLMKFGADLLFSHINTKDHELLYDALDELFNALEIKPIVKYIDEMKNEEVNRDKNVLKERFKKYFPVFTETENIMQQMEKRKIMKTKKFDEDINILEKIQELKKIIKKSENEENLKKGGLSLI